MVPIRASPTMGLIRTMGPRQQLRGAAIERHSAAPPRPEKYSIRLMFPSWPSQSTNIVRCWDAASHCCLCCPHQVGHLTFTVLPGKGSVCPHNWLQDREESPPTTSHSPNTLSVSPDWNCRNTPEPASSLCLQFEWARHRILCPHSLGSLDGPVWAQLKSNCAEVSSAGGRFAAKLSLAVVSIKVMCC